LSDSRIHEFNQRSFIPLCVSTLRLIFHSWKCDVYQFPFHLLLCFHFLVLNNFSNFLLVSIPTMIDQSNESNPVDSHHLVFRAWLSRFGIGKEVYYTKCLTEGHPCLVVFDYGSENNVVRLEKLQLPATFHLDQAWIKFSTWQCVKEVLCDIAPMDSCHLLLGWAWFRFKTVPTTPKYAATSNPLGRIPCTRCLPLQYATTSNTLGRIPCTRYPPL